MSEMLQIDTAGLPSSDRAQVTEMVAEFQRLINDYSNSVEQKSTAIKFCTAGLEHWRLKHYRKGKFTGKYGDKKRSEALDFFITRIPERVQKFISFCAVHPNLPFGSIVILNEYVFTEYLARKPWEKAGWEWDVPKATTRKEDGDLVASGYVQTNICINRDLGTLVRAGATNARSLATFCASAYGWAFRTLWTELSPEFEQHAAARAGQ